MFLGNQKAVKFLERCLEKGTIAQAYLFSGPESVGKFTLAKLFAEALINGNTTILRNVEVTREGRNLFDLLIIEPEKEEKRGIVKEKDIKISEVREAQKFLLTFPGHGKYKILIINDAHKMTEAAQNSLLKILEEPNSTSIIITVTHEPERILPTIKSRCQKINFCLSDDTEIKKCFEKEGEEFDSYLPLLSMGRPGKAKEFLRNKQQFKIQKEFLEELEKIPKYGINDKLALAEAMAKNTSETKKKLELWIWILRKKALDEGKYRNAFCSIEALEKAKFEMSTTHASSRLILENLLISLK